MATYDPSIPDGTNRSLEIAISTDGTPKMNHIYTIEARCGVAVRVGLNQQLTIINPTGHYIEVRNTHKDKVPEEWIRKQTLVNAERYITEELKSTKVKSLRQRHEFKS